MALSRSMKNYMQENHPTGGRPKIGPGFGNPGMSTTQRLVTRGRTNQYPTTSPSVGQTAYRPGYTPATTGPTQKPGRGIGGMLRSAVDAAQSARNQPQKSTGLIDPNQAQRPARQGFPSPGGGAGSFDREAGGDLARRFSGRQGPYGGRAGGSRRALR